MQPFRFRAMLPAVSLALTLLAPRGPFLAAEVQKVEANHVVEIGLTSQKTYDAPFRDVEFDALVTDAGVTILYTDRYAAPSVPSPQDWVLVLEHEKP
jgi:hypothetical protein